MTVLKIMGVGMLFLVKERLASNFPRYGEPGEKTRNLGKLR